MKNTLHRQTNPSNLYRLFAFVGLPFAFLFIAASYPVHRAGIFTENVTEYLSFDFDGSHVALTHRMYPDVMRLGIRSIEQINLSRYDTTCNVLHVAKNYIEIIRQDHKTAPSKGFAMGFSFDPVQDSLPFRPHFAAIQLKDFNWGGLAFSQTDSLNHTGIINEYSQDFVLTITAFANDTVEGHFTGVLLNGMGQMKPVENGRFRVGLLRK